MTGGYSLMVDFKKFFEKNQKISPPKNIFFGSEGDCWGELISRRIEILTRFFKRKLSKLIYMTANILKCSSVG